MSRRLWPPWLFAALALAPLRAAAAAEAPAGGSAVPAPLAHSIDRVVVRFTAPETGGVASPRFIFERELAFEARLEALADAGFAVSAVTPYLDRHVRSALERHMAETLLQSLEITPEPSAGDLQVRMRSARLALVEQVGGEGALAELLRAESLDPGELGLLLARRTRASLYLDRMVATMLTPSDTELRIIHRTTRTPFSAQPYEVVAPLLTRWYVGQRLNAAVRAFYEGARSRIKVTLAALPTLQPSANTPRSLTAPPLTIESPTIAAPPTTTVKPPTAAPAPTAVPAPTAPVPTQPPTSAPEAPPAAAP